MHLPPLETPDQLLDIAFRQARKKAGEIALGKRPKQARKDRELVAVTVAAEYLSQRLWKVVKNFPSVEKLPAFYRELYPTLIDVDKARQTIAHLNTGARAIERLGKESLHALRKTSWEKPEEMKKQKKHFFGRASKEMKKRADSIAAYNAMAKKLRELPSINFSCPTVILAGFPNTGKSTLLKRLTGSPAQIAAYAFTTKQLNVGYFSFNHRKVQVIDTPGLLDKEAGKRNAIEKKTIAAFNHLAHIIVFVVDPTEECGFSLDVQQKLLAQLRSDFPEKPFFVVLNKADLMAERRIAELQQAWAKPCFVEGEGTASNLRESIGENVSGA